MKLQIVKGSTSQIVTVFIQDSTATDGSGLGSLDQTSSIVGGYVRTGATGVALAVDENVTTEGTYEAPSAAGKVRIGTPANMTTGTYELHFHNDLFAAGSNSIFITLGGAADMAVLPIEIQLTSFDLNDSDPDVNVTKWLGQAVAATVNGRPSVDMQYILGHLLTQTGTQLADGFEKFFNVGTPTGTVNSLPDAVPGAAGGVFIAGTNAETTVTTAINANLVGNIGNSSTIITFERMVGSSTHADGTIDIDNTSGAAMDLRSSMNSGKVINIQQTGTGTCHGIWIRVDGTVGAACGIYSEGVIGIMADGINAGIWAKGETGCGTLSQGSTDYPGIVVMNGLQTVPNVAHAVVMMPGTDGDGVYSPGLGAGHGICAVGGATGHGIYGAGGSTSGDGFHGEAQTLGDGLEAVGAGGGYDINADIQGALSGAVGSVTAEVDADMKKIDANSTAATRMKTLYASGVVSGSVDTPGGSETASAFTSDLSETTPDHYNGCVLVLTSGNAQVQARRISDYNGTSKVITVSPDLTEAPANNDTFLVLGRIDGE